MTLRMVFGDTVLPERLEFEQGPTHIQRVTFTRWGEPLDISAPPDRAVVTVAELHAT